MGLLLMCLSYNLVGEKSLQLEGGRGSKGGGGEGSRGEGEGRGGAGEELGVR